MYNCPYGLTFEKTVSARKDYFNERQLKPHKEKKGHTGIFIQFFRGGQRLLLPPAGAHATD